MTREECKQLLVDKINILDGVRQHEFVAWQVLHEIPGFSEIFHPDMLKQLVTENRITTVEYILPSNKSFNLLLPKDTKVVVLNG